jgi:peptidoglycan/xylan/chitin deacetylase (PgdA/CDA1 family)
VDTLGWEGRSAGQTPTSLVRRVREALRPGAIVLMHAGAAPDGSTLDAEALPALVVAIRKRGYDLVAVRPFVFRRARRDRPAVRPVFATLLARARPIVPGGNPHPPRT